MTSTARVFVRVIAIAIAVAGVIDPVLSTTRDAGRDLVAIVAMQGAGAADRLRNNARGWNVVERQATDSRLRCASAEQCVVIADGSVGVDIPSDLERPVSLIANKPSGDPNIELRSVYLTSTHASAAGSARVDLVRTGAIATTDILITDGNAVVGRAAHQWDKNTTAAVDVSWWPMQTGARVLRVSAVPSPGETTTVDNQIDVGVDVINTRASVLVFDARPSWGSTFVRRALEDDPRFVVGHRARVAPSLTTGTANARLDPATLDQIAVLVIGGPDALTTSDVDVLERFVRVRGGTLLLMPEQRITGPAERLLTGKWTEHLTPAPERIGPLYATEVLRSSDEAVGTVLGRSGSMPSIVSTPSGHGLVILSGAMDAWRYRDKDAYAFDRFWQSLVAEGAVAGAALSVTFDRALVARGERARFTIRDRRMTSVTTTEASAVVRCGDQKANAVRLWPSGAIGEFTGEAAVMPPASCRIEASVDGRLVESAFAVDAQPRRGVNDTLTRLVTDVSKTRGVVVSAGEEAELVRALERDYRVTSQLVSIRPLYSAWWMIPFAACLTVEWWLRRRDGLR